MLYFFRNHELGSYHIPKYNSRASHHDLGILVFVQLNSCNCRKIVHEIKGATFQQRNQFATLWGSSSNRYYGNHTLKSKPIYYSTHKVISFVNLFQFPKG